MGPRHVCGPGPRTSPGVMSTSEVKRSPFSPVDPPGPGRPEKGPKDRPRCSGVRRSSSPPCLRRREVPRLDRDESRWFPSNVCTPGSRPLNDKDQKSKNTKKTGLGGRNLYEITSRNFYWEEGGTLGRSRRGSQ